MPDTIILLAPLFFEVIKFLLILIFIMKQTLFLLIIVIFSLGLNAQIPTPKLKFTLTGKLSGINTEKVYLEYYNNVGLLVKDTCKIKNGNFTFTGFIKDPSHATLIGNTKSKNGSNKIDIFIEPGEMKIVLAENQFSQAKIIGSLTQKEFEVFNNKGGTLVKKLDSLFILRETVNERINKASNIQLKEKLNKRLDYINNLRRHFLGQLDQIKISFIEANPNSYINPYLLNQSSLSLDSLKMYYDNWGQSVKNSYYGFFIYTNFHSQLSSKVGCVAPDIETIDVNGKTLKLSGFRGMNVVLLDFWASYCVPCRAFSPHLKVLYQKYHSKGFEIIGVSADTKKDDWLKAIKQDSIEIWYHIPLVQNANTPFNFNPSKDDLRYLYKFWPIPIQYLIDKSGRIVGRYEGRSDENTLELDKKLEELMEK